MFLFEYDDLCFASLLDLGNERLEYFFAPNKFDTISFYRGISAVPKSRYLSI